MLRPTLHDVMISPRSPLSQNPKPSLFFSKTQNRRLSSVLIILGYQVSQVEAQKGFRMHLEGFLPLYSQNYLWAARLSTIEAPKRVRGCWINLAKLRTLQALHTFRDQTLLVSDYLKSCKPLPSTAIMYGACWLDHSAFSTGFLLALELGGGGG